MKQEINNDLIPNEVLLNKIFLIREQKVMLDRDLAKLYNVETKILNKAVKRNLSRFPDDFMFQLTKEEYENLRFQIGTSSANWGGARYLPYAFTEQGIAMLSSVLGSEIAVQVNIRIIRLFTQLRKKLVDYNEILLKLDKINETSLLNKEKLEKHDQSILTIFKLLKQLMSKEPVPRNRIGYKRKDE